MKTIRLQKSSFWNNAKPALFTIQCKQASKVIFQSKVKGQKKINVLDSTCPDQNRELKNHDDDRKWVTVYCASATGKFRRRGVVDDAKQSTITSSCNPQASAGINPLF